MKTTTYSSWFRAKRKLGGTKWDEGNAKQLHQKRKYYAAVIGAVESPECFIEINNSFVLIGFLDDLQRK